MARPKKEFGEPKKEAKEKVFQNNDGQYFSRTEVAGDKAIAEQMREDWEAVGQGGHIPKIPFLGHWPVKR
jgi:hypothetical protein